MAREIMNVSRTPTAVPGLTNGTSYAAQNIDGSIIHHGSFTSPPSAGESGFVVNPNGDFLLQPVSGETVYVWTIFHEYGRIAYDAIQVT